jgi:hypothetical protein
MSNQQELINEALIVADKGLYHKDKIRQVIKADFYNQNTGRISVLGLREKLSKKYGVCCKQSTILQMDRIIYYLQIL